MSVLRRLRERGPAAAVPAAWTVAAGAVLGIVSTHTLFVAHVVMAVLQAGFLAASWTDMTTGALRAWRRVVAAGLLVTVVGGGGLATSSPTAQAAAPVGWALLPAAGLLDTARRGGGGAYLLAGVASGVGGLVVAAGAVAGGTVAVTGVALVGAGQTVGILRAVVDARTDGGAF